MSRYIPAAQAARRRNAILLAAALCGVGLISLLLFFRHETPRQTADGGEAFQEINALSTAVAAGDLGRLDRCAANLQELTETGKFPQPWSAKLGDIISKARNGNWPGAAEDLRWFVRDQMQPVSRGGTQAGRKKRS